MALLYTKFQLNWTKNCRRSYPETKKFIDGRTDVKGYNIIRPFFKRAYKKVISISLRGPFNDIFFNFLLLVQYFVVNHLKYYVLSVSVLLF